MPFFHNHQTRIDWLDLTLNDDQLETIDGYYRLSRKDIQDLLDIAEDSVANLILSMPEMSRMTNTYCGETQEGDGQTFEIDLDAFFDGQGATDLDEEEEALETATDEEEEIEVGLNMENMAEVATGEEDEIDIATVEETLDTVTGRWTALANAEILLHKRPKDARLAPFVRYDQRLEDHLEWVFNSKGLPYNSSTREGKVSRPILGELERSQDWFFQQPDKFGYFPYDARRHYAETPPDAANDFQEPEEPVNNRHLHYNFFCDRVLLRSETPATVSLYAQLVAGRKRMRCSLSREGVILSQANKYIDPVAYAGPVELLRLEGSALQDQTTGYVCRANDSLGHFGELSEEDACIMDFDTICRDHTANGNHVEMQRPYIMDHKAHASAAMGDLVFNGPSASPPQSRNWRHDRKGNVLPKSAYLCSKLSYTEYAYDHCDDNKSTKSQDPLTVMEGPEYQHTLLVTEEAEERVHSADEELGHLQEREISSPPATHDDIGSDSGYASDPHPDVEKLEDHSREPGNMEGCEASSTSEEYSPLNPFIPGLRAAEPEAYQPLEITEAEVDRDFEALLRQMYLGNAATAVHGVTLVEEPTVIVSDDRSKTHGSRGDGASSSSSSTESTDDDDDAGEHEAEEEGQQSTGPTTPTSSTFSDHPDPKISTPAKEQQPSQRSENCPATPEEKPYNDFSDYSRAYGFTVIVIGVVMSLW
ncbi:MAG: hypothetical protein Q9220_002906 [cf. Caloplaca sp. 1 TL-2023]